tara:strand:+ start:276 stop:470 length:195 start_codon:yes stop_codon:yes gene_type:complete
MRIVKGKGTKSRQMAWSNARQVLGITQNTHVYIGSYHSLDYFKSREDLTKEISIRNLTFNNGGL